MEATESPISSAEGAIKNVSEDNKIPKQPPPDDFSKTAPNIKYPKEIAGNQGNDWEKTNYNYPAQPQSEDWGNTAPNIKIPEHPHETDYGSGYQASNQPKASDDWGVTQANIQLPADVGNNPEDFGGGRGTDFTTPLIRLPEAERIKYQNLPPTPTEKAAQKKEENKGGIPGWFWWAAGLMTVFFFSVIILFAVYVLFLNRTGFDLVVKGAPPRSDVMIDGSPWGVTADDGSVRLTNLKANEIKRIEVKHPSYNCEPREIKGADGGSEEMIARCQTIPPKPGEDCTNIRRGEIDKAERCANQALDNLGDPPSIDDLLKALNLFVINFESNKFDIPPARMAFLKRAAGYIQKLPSTAVIEVGGHTDSDGTDAANQTLSENRAKAVYDALLNFGVKSEMLQTKGYGESKPKATNETDDGKFQNRRIEYTAVRR